MFVSIDAEMDLRRWTSSKRLVEEDLERLVEDLGRLVEDFERLVVEDLERTVWNTTASLVFLYAWGGQRRSHDSQSAYNVDAQVLAPLAVPDRRADEFPLGSYP